MELSFLCALKSCIVGRAFTNISVVYFIHFVGPPEVQKKKNPFLCRYPSLQHKIVQRVKSSPECLSGMTRQDSQPPSTCRRLPGPMVRCGRSLCRPYPREEPLRHHADCAYWQQGRYTFPEAHLLPRNGC